MTGMSQSTLAQIESGRRAISAELLERILRAADYRPSVPLARYATSISSYARNEAWVPSASSARLPGARTDSSRTLT